MEVWKIREAMCCWTHDRDMTEPEEQVREGGRIFISSCALLVWCRIEWRGLESCLTVSVSTDLTCMRSGAVSKAGKYLKFTESVFQRVCCSPPALPT